MCASAFYQPSQIAAKKRSHLENYDYYQYNKYQKITFSLNDIKPADLDSILAVS